MNLATPSKVLIVCPHTDDEFGCAGSIARWIQEGSEVHYLALSSCEDSVPQGMPLDTLEKECRNATRRLGIREGEVSIMDFPVRKFPAYRQEILEHLVRLSKIMQPDLVLLPSSYDTHQDHKTVAEEGFRAFKSSSILGYELPQNLISFRSSAYVKLSEAHLELKLSSLAEYKSQIFRPYASAEFIRSLATVRGAQVRVRYAEAFEQVRLII